jgi:hypothetical protein
MINNVDRRQSQQQSCSTRRDLHLCCLQPFHLRLFWVSNIQYKIQKLVVKEQCHALRGALACYTLLPLNLQVAFSSLNMI